MKKVTKAAALALGLAMVFNLSACGTQKGAESQGSQGGREATAAPKEAGSQDKSQETTAAQAAVSVPELKGPGNVTLKRLGEALSWDPNTDGMAEVIEQTTGYHTEYFTLPSQNADEKLVMDISGGADYDVLRLNTNQWRTLVAQGALQPLDDLLEVYGQDILQGNSEKVWESLRGEDGHIYGVPYMYPHSHEITTYMQCRWDLMQEAGITKIPETIDEFYDCLVTLKNYYGDEYIIFTGPYTPSSEGNENWVIPKTIACAFGIYNDWMVDDSGKVYYITEAPRFGELLEFLTKLYEEGLIDSEWAINTNSTIQEKFASGRALITAANRTLSGKCSKALIDNEGLTWDDIGYISTLKDSNGVCTYMSSEAINQVGCIPRSSQNAADAINWINLKVQNQLFINMGTEGVHFNYDSEGQIEPINPIFADERGNAYYYNDCTNAEEFEFEWPARVRKSEGQWHGFSATTMNADQSVFVENTFSFMPARENYTKYNTALFNNLQDFILQIISGTRSIDDLATFQSDWANNGGEDVRKEMQTWYDEFYK